MRVEDASRARTNARTGTGGWDVRRVLALLRERLSDAGGVLRLEPEDLRSLGIEAGIEGDAAVAFRALVRSNRVRLRGRWREGVSGVTAPVYVARIAGPAP